MTSNVNVLVSFAEDSCLIKHKTKKKEKNLENF